METNSVTTETTAPETFDALRQRIARSSLIDPNNFALSTTAALGEALGIQPSTLIRFAKEFGYAGFSDLQRVEAGRPVTGSVRSHQMLPRL